MALHQEAEIPCANMKQKTSKRGTLSGSTCPSPFSQLNQKPYPESTGVEFEAFHSVQGFGCFFAPGHADKSTTTRGNHLLTKSNKFISTTTTTHIPHGNGTEGKVCEKKTATDRNKELDPGSLSLVTERALTTGLK